MLRVAQEGSHAERDTALLYFLLDTMCRAAELRSATIPPPLRQSPPDLSEGVLTITGKGDKPRRIHYEAETAAVLRRYLDGRLDSQPWLFVGPGGQQFYPSTLGKIITELGHRANIRGIRVSPHSFRHTAAVRFLQAHPGHIAQLKARLGHEQLDMTLRYATRADEEITLQGGSALALAGLPQLEVQP